ncbi:MAG: 2-iminoacetate synthase ThiH [Verrucomicrobia bacterium]|nr:2-iminoacetate synthase ThiH [Verrucomicrobiota bacterium]MBI3868291.1 2-iminoacetate synthase ThiH [Verrucomicrobiota bacterium]
MVRPVSFVSQFNSLPWASWLAAARSTACADIDRVLAKSEPLTIEDFAALISPAAEPALESMARGSQTLTRRRFGRVIRLFAPLYLSNECVNNCQYCGFSRDNPIRRVTLDQSEVRREGEALAAQGFRNVLLVAGEHPKFVSNGYLEDSVQTLRELIPSVSLEVGPMDREAYERLVARGAEGLVVYQETYDRTVYAEMHTVGPKRDFDWRLETPERAYAAGFRRLGIGALFGLSDWRGEALALASHALYLLRHCWKAQITISLPRLRPCAGEFQPRFSLSDRELTQLVCAMRLLLPDAGIVLSTRESEPLRDGLIPLGVTMISAGSHTEPGGYTGAGQNRIHYTQRGRIISLADGASEWAERNDGTSGATGQFDIADHRSPAEMAERLRRIGYEPVWKDWEWALAPSATATE